MERRSKLIQSLLAVIMALGLIAPQVQAEQSPPAAAVAAASKQLFSIVPTAVSDHLLKVEKPLFTNYEGERIHELSTNGFIRANVTVKNESASAIQATMIVALFNAGNIMENVAFIDKHISADSEEVFNAGFKLPPVVTGKYVKVFVWDSFTRMQPLSNSYRFPALDDEYENLALGLPYTVTQSFPDRDVMAYELRTARDNGTDYELTDGKTAVITEVSAFQDKNWTGFGRQVSRSVVLDLGETKYVDSVIGGFLQERLAAVELPRYINFALSNDNVNWYSAGQLKPEYSNSQAASRQELAQTGINVAARYVKVEFEVGMFTFVDEIQVLGRDAKPSDRSVDVLPAEVAPVDAAPPTLAESGGVKNMYLVYYYPADGSNSALGRWVKDDFKSVIAHTDTDGNRTGWLFDTMLFTQGGSVFNDYTTKDKWQMFLDEMFKEGQHIGALNAATEEAKEELDDPEYKTKVVISVPFPNPESTVDWGVLNEETINFGIRNGEEASFEARTKAIDWYIDTAMELFDEKGYEHLELAGFYWLREEVPFRTTNEEDLIKHTSNKIHSLEKKFYWIPFFQSNGITIWKDLGFDAVMMQPNYFFSSAYGPNSKAATVDLSRLQTTVATAKRFGMGVEVEGDYHITWSGWATDYDGQLYNGDYSIRKYYAYLNELVRSQLNETITGYYVGARTVLRDIYNSSKPKVRAVYDDTAKFINGDYEKIPIDETEIPLPVGDTWDNPVNVDAVEGDIYISADNVSSRVWIKFPIKAGEDWVVTLTPLNGSKFDMETRHWASTQTPHSGFSYGKSADVQSMLVSNPGHSDTHIMLRVFPNDGSSGKFKVSLSKPVKDGTSMMNAIDLPNASQLAGTAAGAGKETWYKVTGLSSYELHLVSAAGSDFNFAWYWDANSGTPRGSSNLGPGQADKLTFNNQYAPSFVYYVKVTAATAGSYTLYNGITPPDVQPIRGNTYANAIELNANEGVVYNSATLSEAVLSGAAKWLKFPVATGEEWEITITPAAGSEVAMETRWVEGPALKYTYSYQSKETQPKSLTIKNDDDLQKFAYIRTLAQQTGGHYTISLRKLES